MALDRGAGSLVEGEGLRADLTRREDARSATGPRFRPFSTSVEEAVTWQSLAQTKRYEIRFPTLILPAGQYATRLSYSVAAFARVGASPSGSAAARAPKARMAVTPIAVPRLIMVCV